MAKISGGVSNVSFSFRGNNQAREAIHSVFLFHAIKAGMTMGIVNAGQLAIYEKLQPKLKEYVEDLVFCKSEDATEKLIELSSTLKGGNKDKKQQVAWRKYKLEKRIEYALINGITEFIVQDTEKVRKKISEKSAIIKNTTSNLKRTKAIRTKIPSVPTPG